jgi:outer membrane biosynthesis protein TonB
MSHAPALKRNRISAATLAGDRRSPAGWIGALTLHAGIVAAMLFTWSHTLDIADRSPPVVPVDLISIADKTNIAPTAIEQPKPQDQPQPDMLQAVQPPLQAEAAPDTAPSSPLIKPAQPPPTPKLTPRPSAEAAKPDKFDINHIVALLDKKAPAANAQSAKPGAHDVKGIGAQSAMTLDLRDALRNQIAQCWSPPVGAPHPEQMIVTYELFLNPDGSVAQPPQLAADSAAAASRDPFMRAAAEAARRAIYTCAPYKLPANRYSQWRDIEFEFNPRDMLQPG